MVSRGCTYTSPSIFSIWSIYPRIIFVLYLIHYKTLILQSLELYKGLRTHPIVVNDIVVVHITIVIHNKRIVRIIRIARNSTRLPLIFGLTSQVRMPTLLIFAQPLHAINRILRLSRQSLLNPYTATPFLLPACLAPPSLDKQILRF